MDGMIVFMWLEEAMLSRFIYVLMVGFMSSVLFPFGLQVLF